MLDLKTMISKTSTDPELNRVRAAIRKESRDHMQERFRAAYERISQRWGLMFNDDQIIVPADLRKKLLQTLHFGHAGNTKMTAEAKKF